MIIKLLKKSVVLNKKNIIIGIFVAIFFSTIQYDGNKYYLVSLVMCPSLLFSFAVGKLCYMEDDDSTKVFISSLPISQKSLIIEKNLLSYLCIILGMIISQITQYILYSCFIDYKYMFSYSSILLISSVCIIYNTIYLVLNYKLDYSKTQLTPYFMLAIMLLFFKYGVILGSLDIDLILCGIILMICVVINFILINLLSINMNG
ncbi:MAG: ABC-2 transporter permease [Filifactoraceae bacterium]